MMFNMIEFIEKKRDKGRHGRDEFNELIANLMAGEAPDYQLSAWLMAAFLNGLDDDETMYFTEALAKSGESYSFPADLHIVDKHSTGGVGDKATLVLLPLAAACGASVSKLSGPGLGFTGGTVDKLESIPGMRMHLEPDEFLAQVRRIGCAISGHSKQLAPAEGRFYKLRDVTGTVPSTELITASIVSKKLAGGAFGYVFDVKCGSGAFMKDREAAAALAENLVKVSKKLGKGAVAAITDMEQPLGEWVGNASEVFEAVEVLNGRGPADTRKLCVTLCGLMLAVASVAKDAQEGAKIAERALDDGSALKKFAEIITAQGGDPEVVRHPLEILPRARKSFLIKSSKRGYLSKLDALSVGEALRALGGGRMKLDDKIDHAVSVHLMKKVGDAVSVGDTVIELLYNDDTKLAEAMKYLTDCWSVSEKAERRELILDYVF